MDAHVPGRLDLQATLLVRAMVNADVETGERQMLVCQMLEELPEIPKLHLRRGKIARQQFLVGKLEISLAAKPVGANRSRRHHHMGMVVANVAVGMRCMNGKIDSRAIAIGKSLCEGARQRQALPGVKLMRQRDLEFAGNPRVLSGLGNLGSIPQGRPVLRPFRHNTIGQDDFGMGDTLLVGEVMRKPVTLVLDP